ncbi:DSBA oxidoreductase [Salinisphaera dokdonensis CL-ES53]|uniref:DSBA oxidoreductase n=1 Tax=Salinisphaera dokdonensis CL-ES53 TaxID=1304272 RepID=A0ABV2B4G7_9GAMM
MQTIKIDLVSDVVCPWCAIGDARLQQAMDRLADEYEFEVEWHPFLLNPDVPAEGRDILEHLSAKYGRSVEEMKSSQYDIINAARELGLNFEKALERRSWSTFDTHRVLAYAKEHGQDAAFNRALFEAYFGRAESPTDPEVIVPIAESLGLDGARVREILASDEYAEQVEREIAHWQSLGVSSVPSFIVDNKYLLAGAQPPETLADALRQIAGERAESA